MRTGARAASAPGASESPAAAISAPAAGETAAAASMETTAAAMSANPTRSTRGRTKVKEGSLLAERAAREYVYVGVDLRRIVVVAAVLMGTLLALWLFFTTVDPFGIY